MTRMAGAHLFFYEATDCGFSLPCVGRAEAHDRLREPVHRDRHLSSFLYEHIFSACVHGRNS